MSKTDVKRFSLIMNPVCYVCSLQTFHEHKPHQSHSFQLVFTLRLKLLMCVFPVCVLPVNIVEEEEALHGKLEEDRFLFSLENDSAACDVLDLREVLSVFLKDG